MFGYFLEHGYSAHYVKYYFEGVSFKGVDKEALYDDLENMVINSSLNNNQTNTIIQEVLKRDRVNYLSTVVTNDVCISSNLTECQNIKSIDLNSSSVYLTLNKESMGDTQILDEGKRGEDRYSTITIPIIDSNDTQFDLKVRVAKVATNSGVGGKLLKINDPTAVESGDTKVIFWVDLSDNPKLKKGVNYHATTKAILNVYKKGENSDEKLGLVSLEIPNIIVGDSKTMSSPTYLKEYASNPKTGYYFLVNDPSIGPTEGIWYGERGTYSTINIPVVDDEGNSYTLKLKATHNDLNYNEMLKMNAATIANTRTTFKLEYIADDNQNIASGTHLKSLKPFTIDTRMWHLNGDIYERIYMSIDFVTP